MSVSNVTHKIIDSVENAVIAGPDPIATGADEFLAPGRARNCLEVVDGVRDLRAGACREPVILAPGTGFQFDLIRHAFPFPGVPSVRPPPGRPARSASLARRTSPLCRIPARNRLRLERLCRYAARPPVATHRLSLLPDGRLLYRLRHRWRDGTTHVIFEPLDLLSMLAALVPPPRFNVVRYHGILVPAAALRPLVVPESETAGPQECGFPRSSRCASPTSTRTV